MVYIDWEDINISITNKYKLFMLKLWILHSFHRDYLDKELGQNVLAPSVGITLIKKKVYWMTIQIISRLEIFLARVMNLRFAQALIICFFKWCFQTIIDDWTDGSLGKNTSTISKTVVKYPQEGYASITCAIQ